MVEPFSYKNMTTTSKLTLYAGPLSVHISSIMALRSDSSFLFTLGPINLDGHSNIMICTKSAVLHYLGNKTEVSISLSSNCRHGK